MQKLIVTADDYGMCDAVDKAIDAGIENGFITTTNVMVNMESQHNAKDLRERYPHISVGLHWNVTTGKPVSNPANIPTLVDDNGMFWSIGAFKKRYSRGLIAPNDLEYELDAQYAKYIQICGGGGQTIGTHTRTHPCIQKHIRCLKRLRKNMR